MSSSSSYRSVDSEDDTTSWLVSSEDSMDDEDELTLLNGDEENDENSTTFEAFIRLSMRLKKQYNLREASVSLERCDKIWDTMQLLKSAQSAYKVTEEVDETDEEDDEVEDRSKSCTSDSIASSVSTGAVSYIKYQPTQGNGNNALPNFYLSVKKQTKIYNCGTCGKIYNEKRAFKIHMKRDHGIALSGSPQNRKRSNNSETRPKTPQTTDTSSVDGEKTSRPGLSKTKNVRDSQHPCPVCGNIYAYRRSLRIHALNVHGLDVWTDLVRKRKNERQTMKSDTTDISYVYTHAVINNCKNYFYFCIICHKQWSDKRALRSHMRVEHQIDVPKGPEGTLSGLFIKDVDTAREYLRRLPRNEAFDENASQLQTQRAGPKSSKTPDRPKRACTVNTCYEDQSKEEEEILRGDEISSKTSSQSPSSGHTTKCFLCKRSCADMIRHLKEYHRISKPDSVLPLNEHVSNDPITEDICVKDEIIEDKESEEEKESSNQKEITSDLKSPSRKRSNKIDPEILESLNAQIKGLYRKVSGKRHEDKTIQCLMCMTKYTRMWGLKYHLSTKMKDGVVQMHGPRYVGRPDRLTSPRSRTEKKKETAQDPLKLDDTSTIDSESSSVKRRSSCSDESSSTSEVISSKRRKIEFSKDIDKSSDTGSDESEVDTTLRKSKKTSRYNRAEEKPGDGGEDKSPGQRDTRDSSDRDSGIGISITIKKRNNSYEVVEKDCEEVKAVDSRPRATSDPLDCPEELSINKSTTISTQDQDDDDVTIVECTDSTFMRTVEQMNRQENVRTSHKASRKIPGKVSSLKVLCRNILKRHRVSRFMENHVNSHQCPVCCRFYATERDVTVHMLAHKVSKTTFRCAGMFGIPRSALRRYGKRKTLPVIQDAWR